jgi:cellobiose epimerase
MNNLLQEGVGIFLKKKRVIFILAFFYFSIFSIHVLAKSKNNFQTSCDSAAVEMRSVLDNMFKLWYPLCIDTVYGGYYSDINYKWELSGRQNKMIVTQARHIWSASNAALFYDNPEKKKELVKIAKHGFEFLRDKMWDKEYGGFYNLVNRQGEPVKERGEVIKNAYGNAFAIYGLAAYYKASGNKAALKLAEETFNWLDKNSYDPAYGGYFQFISREGKPFKDGYRNVPPKDQNSSIHILEAFTELYSVDPNAKLKERLTSLLHLIRDKIVTNKGYLTLYLKRDLTPISYKDSSDEVRNKNYELDHVSFGHDIETAYLMLDASEALGIKNDTTTLRVAKKMVDHSLKNGWDKKYGGLFDGGYYYNNKDSVTILRNTKEWWSQVEALNSALLMSELFPGDEMNYHEKFCEQWNYIKEYLIDNDNGGWYWGGIDQVPQNKVFPKGTIWKADYHTSRAMINCLIRLKRLNN